LHRVGRHERAAAARRAPRDHDGHDGRDAGERADRPDRPDRPAAAPGAERPAAPADVTARLGDGAGGFVAAPAAPALGAPRPGWLRSPAFDAWFIGGTLALALTLGRVASAGPTAFTRVLLADLWLLAYPHVASTYTRVAFDRPSARRHWFLLAALPPLVLAATSAVAWAGGLVALNSVYFYWQSWHYARQSYGIARAYRRARGPGAAARDPAADAVVYAFPLWGVLHRAAQRPATFYGMPLWCPPAPRALASAAGAAACGALVIWARREARAARAAGAVSGHGPFVLSHVAVAVVSYVAVDDVTAGWLYLNVWHNAQYLLFVWAFHARRFAGGPDPASPLLSWLARPSRWPAYAGACAALGALFYLALGAAVVRLPAGPLPALLVAHLAVNFHHYVTDAVIWRAPRPSRRPGG
jgi:hypothetical protein